MKAVISAATALCLLIFAASCGSDPSTSREGLYHASSATTADSIGGTSASAPAASEDEQAMSLNEPARKIIKTADLRCRVGDVYAATTHIERLANATGGQLSDSRLENATEQTRFLPYKPDSLQQVTSFTTTAHLTLRIPVSLLDTVLADIAGDAAFINNRSLHLDDVTLRYLSNKLKNDAMAANDAPQRARTLARRTGDAVFSGDYTDARNDTRIDRRIENMQLTDQVTYATLTVDLYQPQRISRMIMPDIDFLMKPTMGQQVMLALNNGWQLLRAILVGLLQIWPVVIIAVIAVFLFRKRIRKGAAKATTAQA